MRKALFIALIVFFMAFLPQPTAAAPAEQTDVGMLFGGQWAQAEEPGISSTNLEELPPVVEVYTATWCGNCVDVEHALDDIENDTGLQQYHIHRAINEIQDPLGSIEIDQHFIDRYGTMAPPAVVFNGTTIKAGSVPNDAASLEDEFTLLSDIQLALVGNSSFAWVPNAEDGGIVAWSLNIENMAVPEGSSIVAQAWIVEESARFEDGSNGLENYPHVVRGIIELGKMNSNGESFTMTGNTTVSLPSAYDGSDLSVHLLYQLNYATVTEETEQQSWPLLEVVAFLIVGVLSVVFILRSRRQNQTEKSLSDSQTNPVHPVVTAVQQEYQQPIAQQPMTVAQPAVLQQWTDDTGYTWRRMDDGSYFWWTGSEWKRR